MSHGIHKDDVNRWFLVYDNDPGESGFVLFGYVGTIDVNELVTGQPNILSYLTEDELETQVFLLKTRGKLDSEMEKLRT